MRVLDFGCGTGRFASRLAEEGITVIGMDISREMLKHGNWQPKDGLPAIQIEPGQPLPMASGSFDGLWICTVLQHIDDFALPGVLAELRRLLCPNAQLLLCENTEQGNGRWSKSGHITYRQPEEYAAALPGLAIVDHFMVEGERHTIFAGRLARETRSD